MRTTNEMPERRLELLGPYEVSAVVCLGCGHSYRKPFTRNSWEDNPGCPRCGYNGWADRAALPRIRSNGVRAW